jgi:hypothetical protein
MGLGENVSAVARRTPDVRSFLMVEMSGLRRLLARYRLSVDFEFRDVGPAALTMSAAGHQIHKTDLIDLAQIWIGDDAASRNTTLGIEAVPAES